MVIRLSALGGSEKKNQGCALQNKTKSTEEGTKKQREVLGKRGSGSDPVGMKYPFSTKEEESSRNPCFEFYFGIFEFTTRNGERPAGVGRRGESGTRRADERESIACRKMFPEAGVPPSICASPGTSRRNTVLARPARQTCCTGETPSAPPHFPSGSHPWPRWRGPASTRSQSDL